jgi:DNA-binding MarR family transcriptional regulator
VDGPAPYHLRVAASPPSPSPESHELTEVVLRLRRALRASVRTDIPWESLPMAQVELLQTLVELPPMRVGDLADRLHLANSTVSGLVGQMMDAGLVARHTDQSDRRAASVAVTDAGRARLAEWERAHERRIGAALDQLSAANRTSVVKALPALGRLAEILSSEREDGAGS